MSAYNLHVPIIHLGTSSALEQTPFRDYDDADDDDDDDGGDDNDDDYDLHITIIPFSTKSETHWDGANTLVFRNSAD